MLHSYIMGLFEHRECLFVEYRVEYPSYRNGNNVMISSGVYQCDKLHRAGVAYPMIKARDILA